VDGCGDWPRRRDYITRTNVKRIFRQAAEFQ